MKRAILRLLTQEYDLGIVAREIIKLRHEPGQIRVKVRVRNKLGHRLAEACAVVTLNELQAEELRYLQEQARQLLVEPKGNDVYFVRNPDSGSAYEVKKVATQQEIIWDCNCLHFAKMGRRDCKHAMAAELMNQVEANSADGSP